MGNEVEFVQIYTREPRKWESVGSGLEQNKPEVAAGTFKSVSHVDTTGLATTFWIKVSS